MAAAGPFGLGPLELGLIIVVLLMLFGATRLADLGGSLGKGIKEFRRNIKEDEEDKPTSVPSAETADKVMDRPEVISALKCPNCGTLNPMGARHCNQCGASLATPVS